MTIENHDPPSRIIALHDLRLLPSPVLSDGGRGAPGAERRDLRRPRAARLARSRRGRRADPTRTGRPGAGALRQGRRDPSAGRVDSSPTSTSAGVAVAATTARRPGLRTASRSIAYAALIESTTGQTVAEGRVRYHADNVTVRVPFDDAARADLAEAIATARRLRESTERPPVTENERLCVRCSLAPVCLPEEVRQAEDPDHEPFRLFPPDRDGTSLHVVTPGATVGRSGEELVVRHPDGEPDPASTDPRARLHPAPRPLPRSRPRRCTSAPITTSPSTG